MSFGKSKVALKVPLFNFDNSPSAGFQLLKSPTTEGELSKLKTGTFKATFDLPKDNSFEFKYLVDGSYLNDPEADSYAYNEFAGAENSVLAL